MPYTNPGRFGEMSRKYLGSPIRRNPAMAPFQDEKANAIYFVKQEPTELVEELFKGADSIATGDYAKACEDRGGQIKGKGPDCEPLEEEGEKSSAECHYNFILECIREYRENVFNATNDFISTLIANTAYVGWYPRNADVYGPDRSGLNNFESARADYTEAEDIYKECIKEVKNECECKRCVVGIPIPKPPEEDEDDEEEEADPPEPPREDSRKLTKTFRSVSTSSSTEPIPRVWGRYVVGGNIIWIGNTTTVQREIQIEVKGENVEETTIFDTYVDFKVGLCAGPIGKLLRVWFDDLLVLNDVLDADAPQNSATDLDLSALTRSDYDLTTLASRMPQIELREGSDTQGVSAEHAIKDGFGRAVAYRGQTYVHFKNINLALFGNGFPKLRFDVVTESQPLAGELIGDYTEEVNLDYLELDAPRGELFTTLSSGGYRAFDWDEMTPGDEGQGQAQTFRVLLPSGMVLCTTTGDFNVRVADPTFSSIGGRTVSEQSFGLTLAQNSYGAYMYSTVNYYDTAAKTGYDLTIGTLDDNRVLYFVYDYAQESLLDTFSGGLPLAAAPYAPSVATVWATEFAYVGGIGKYFQFYLPNTTRNALNMVSYDVITAAGALSSTLTATITSFANTAIWNTDTSNVQLCNVMHDAGDNSFVLFVKAPTSGTYWITKISATTRQVVWQKECDFAFSSWNNAEHIASRSTSRVHRFISDDEEIIELDLTTGETTLFSALSDFASVTYTSGSAQVYDGRTGSLCFISDTGSDPLVVRLILGRASAERISLKTIIDDIAEKTQTLRGLIDASAVSGITVEGYAAFSGVSIASFLEKIATFYQLTLVDDGTRLTMLPKSTLSTSVVIDPETDVLKDSAVAFKGIGSTLPEVVQVSFVTISDLGLDQNIQSVSVRGDVEDSTVFVNQLDFSLDINESPETVRRYAEQVLRASRAEQSRLKLGLMPRMLAITPHTPIEYRGKEYIVGRSLLSFDNAAEIEGAQFDFDDYATQVSLSAVDISGNEEISRFQKAYKLRPNVLFINAVNNEDAMRAVSTGQIVYTVIEGPVFTIPELRVAMRTLPQSGFTITRALVSDLGVTEYPVETSPLYVSKTHRYAAHYGFMTDVPKSSTERPQPFTTDADDELTVSFAREDTVEYIQTLPSLEEEPYTSVLDSAPSNMLIVGKELIQFASYEVIDTTTVRFYNIFRGVRGTENYMNHTTADRVYLYTEDTVLPMTVNAAYTKFNNKARVWLRGVLPAGYSPIEYITPMDAGSARPWAPTDMKVYALNGDPTRLRIAFKRRNPLIFNQLENGGIQPCVYGAANYLITGISQTTYQAYGYSDFLATNNIYGPLDVLYNSLPDDTVVTDFEITHASATSGGTVDDQRLITIAQVGLDSNGEPVIGHPAFFHIPVGVSGTYPTTP